MKITVAQSAGFCFGVKRAISIACDTAAKHKNVVMLGDIVHNEDVVKTITALGIKKVNKLIKNQDAILLIRAHGATRKTYETAKRLGYKLIDATCTTVKEIHQIAKKNEHRGYAIIIIGDKKHDEVLGIAGQLKKKAIIIDKMTTIPYASLKKIKKAAIVVQSTQGIKKVLAIVETVKKTIPEVLFFNTICKPTRIKQNEIQTMPLENDVMIIIGSKKSANTKRLYELSKSLNKKSFWIQSKNDINPSWFTKAQTTGITAGASTPDATTKSVVTHIRALIKNK